MGFRLLGPFEVVVGIRSLTIARRRERCLLAVLALEHGRSVPADRLVDLLWDGRPPAAAAATLRTHVSRLRAVLPPDFARIQKHGAGYALETRPERIDVHRFRRLVALAQDATEPAGRAGLLNSALALWRGPALADIASDLARQRLCQGLEESRLEALEQRIDAELRLGRHRELVGELFDLVANQPSREGFVAQLMLALHRCGRQADALAAFDEHRRLLRTEMGLDPGADIQALHERVLRVDPALDLAASTAAHAIGPNFLPYDVPDFTGRAREFAQLLRQSAGAGTVVISAVDGMAGVGKTALALHVAHRLADRYPDGRLFVDLHAHTAGRSALEPSVALETMLRAMGVAAEGMPNSAEERAALWRARLSGLRVLVVLDNAASAEQVRTLLPGTPGCLVIVTSRRRLTALAGAVPMTLDVLPPEDGVALFSRMVTAERAGQEPDAVAEVVDLCGRLPLAIRIAAARLRARPVWTVGEMAGRLRGERGRLSELEVDDQRVAAAFTLSYRQLHHDQQRIFRLLGACPGVDVDAYAVAALAGLSVEKAEMLLESLLDVHLLVQRTPGRYLMHDLLRDFARDVGRDDEAVSDHATSIHRLLDYYLHTTELANNVLMPSRGPVDCAMSYPPSDHPTFADHAEALRWCDTERGNLVAVIRHAAANGFDRYAWSITHNLAMYLLSGGHIDDSVTVHTVAIETARRAGAKQAETIALINLATGYWLADQYDLALEYATRALALARAVGDGVREAVALCRIAALNQHLGRDDCAVSFATEGLAVARAADNPREVIFGLWVLSTVQVGRGQAREALANATEMLAVARRIAEPMWESAGLVRTGAARAALGEHAEALEMFRAALVVARRIDDPTHEAEALLETADTLRLLQRCAEALDAATTAFEILHRGARPSLTSAAHNVLSAIHVERGDVDAARDQATRALALARSIGHRPNELRAADNLAVIGA